MSLKSILKTAVHGLCLLFVFPFALTAGFGRFAEMFRLWAHYFSLFPGIPGDYIRVAYYSLTLTKCHRESRIQFGAFFAHPEAVVSRLVFVGSYSIIGKAHIGERTQIASGVQILSGRSQHSRSADGVIGSATEGSFSTVSIGADCWIGASAIVMADVGSSTTIGAGAVVVKAIPGGVVAVGNPARVLEPTR